MTLPNFIERTLAKRAASNDIIIRLSFNDDDER